MARRLWFRAALFTLMAVATALVAAGAEPFIPYEITASIGVKAVDNILGLLASGMLAVTTFSLASMVSAGLCELAPREQGAGSLSPPCAASA